jgi:hypothetical protein
MFTAAALHKQRQKNATNSVKKMFTAAALRELLGH